MNILIKSFLLIILIFLNINISSSLPGYKLFMPSGLFYDVYMFDTTSFIICGQYGNLIKTTDGGNTFKYLDAGCRRNLNAIKFFNKTDGIIVEDSGFVAITKDGGNSWINTKIGNYNLFCVDFNNSTILIGGENGIFSSDNMGISFQEIYSNPSVQIKKIKMLENDIVFAMGSNAMYKSENSGKNWNEFIENNSNYKYTAFDFYDEKTGFIAYYDKTSPFPYDKVNIKTSDGGKTWDSVLINFTHYINAAKMINAKHVAAVGDYLITTDDFFNTWKADTLNVKGYTNLLLPFLPQISMSNIIDNNFVSIGLAYIISYNNYGRDFNVLKWTLLDFTGINGALRIEPDIILLYTNRSKIYRSQDNGVTFDYSYPKLTDYINMSDMEKSYWSNVTAHSSGLYSGFVRDNYAELYGINAGTSNQSLSTETKDGGITWKNTDKIPVIGDDINFFDDNNAITICNKTNKNFVQLSSDGCKTWKSININDKSYFYGNINIINDSSALMAASNNIKTDDTAHYPSGYKYIYKILKTTNKGNSFDTIVVFDNLMFYSPKIKIIGENHYLFYSNLGIIKETTDGGQSWSDIKVPFKSLSLYYVLDSNNVICTSTKDTLAISTDGGMSWYLEYIPRIGTMGKILKISKNEYFIYGGADYFILKKADSASAVNEGSKIEGNYNKYFYVAIDPSPIDNYAVIGLYGLYSVRDFFVQVKIYDVNANIVRDISQEANSNNNGFFSQFIINFSDLRPGVYFLEMSANSYSFVRKFIKAY